MKQSNLSRRSELKDKENKIPEHHFSELRAENHSGTFPAVEDWLYKANIRIINQKNERKLQKMKNYFFAHKLRLVYTIAALLVIIGACNMPVTQTESAGQVITMVIPADNTGFQDKMNSLPWMKNAQVSSNENTNNGVKQIIYTVVLPNTTEEQARSYSNELEAIGGITTIKITPMNYDVKRPLYSAALHDFFSIDIDATGMTDEELQSEVQRKLKEQGVDMKIQFKTGADGRRDVHLEGPDNDKLNKEPKSYELNIEDNNGQEKIKLLQKHADPDKFKGKTDEEIRKMVREDAGNPDLKDEEIKISRNGDGVQVKVEVNRKENR